ncbi:MAG: hypothetical protein KW793_04175 [Candidatus Doudnabacteria bacterium]|nr:hypothetical protein [Candidatus Doudnabacteria bacterium]
MNEREYSIPQGEIEPAEGDHWQIERAKREEKLKKEIRKSSEAARLKAETVPEAEPEAKTIYNSHDKLEKETNSKKYQIPPEELKRLHDSIFKKKNGE